MIRTVWKLTASFFLAFVLTRPGTPAAEVYVDVGDEAPDFELSDSAGRAYKLSDFRGEKAVVLEFFRSGDW
jgi:hypothetical protein